METTTILSIISGSLGAFSVLIILIRCIYGFLRNNDKDRRRQESQLSHPPHQITSAGSMNQGHALHYVQGPEQPSFSNTRPQVIRNVPNRQQRFVQEQNQPKDIYRQQRV